MPHRRKLATFLFCDLVGSTALGDEVDVEVVRELTFAYFSTVRQIIEDLGGHVEKFIGDAVFGAFGLSVTREDDALRAVRAGLEIQQQVKELNARFEVRYGRRIELRIGINTDDVIVGDVSMAEPLVAGDAANVAARLQAVAEPGSVLVGENTHRLVRDVVEADQVEPIAAKGKSTPLRAFTVHSVSDPSPSARDRARSGFVNRHGELSALRSAYEACVDRGDWRLALLVGRAGMGKSRLAKEFLARIGESATVLRCRCLPPGDGPAYGPLIDLISQLNADGADRNPADELLDRVVSIVGEAEGPQVARALNAAAGFKRGQTSPSETAWASRRLLESMAMVKPVVLLLDDIHWAATQLVEMLDRLITDLRPVPIFVICLSRPDGLPDMAILSDDRVGIFPVDALSDSDTSTLIGNNIGNALDDRAQHQVVSTAEGNPLYVEELLSMLIDDGLVYRVDGAWHVADMPDGLSVPVGIEALLHARFDALPETARGCLERAAVVGQNVPAHLLRDLTVDVAEAVDVKAALELLVERDLLVVERSVDERSVVERSVVERSVVERSVVERSVVERSVVERSVVAENSAVESSVGIGGYSFRHVLIQSVAYSRNPKSIRADLHQRVAKSIEGAASESGAEGSFTTDEVVGFHLEQAVAYRRELLYADDTGAQLAGRAGQYLESAGVGHLIRSDLSGAAGLFERSSSLLAQPERWPVECLWGSVLGEAGELREAVQLLDRVVGEAEERSDDEAAILATVERLIVEMQTEPGEVATVVRNGFKLWLKELENQNNTLGLGRLWHLDALVHWHEVQCDEAASSWSRSAAHAAEIGDVRRLADSLSWLASAAFYGPMRAADAVLMCRGIIDQLGEDRLARSQVLLSLACLEAMVGNGAEAANLVAESDETALTIGPHLTTAAPHREAFVAKLRGDYEDAERRLATGIEQLREIGERALLSTNAALLAHVLIAQDRDAEALDLTVVSEQEAAADDLATQIAWRTARAKISARAGDLDSGLILGQQALTLASGTDCLVDHADAVLDFAEIVGLGGDATRRRTLLGEACELYWRKGHLVGYQHCRNQLESA